MRAAIRKVVGEAPLQKGKVKLDLPPLVENGNAVPLTVSVDSPMTETDHVKAIHIFNEKNPQPNVSASVSGRAPGRPASRPASGSPTSQTVMAIAELSDGTFWSDSVDVIVTFAACVERIC